MSRKRVFLFMRGSNKEKCICCGQLKCHTHKQNEENDLFHLVLELLQFNELNTDPYMCGVTKQFVILIILSRVSILFALLCLLLLLLLCLPFSMKWHHIREQDMMYWRKGRRALRNDTISCYSRIQRQVIRDYHTRRYRKYTQVMPPSLSDDYNQYCYPSTPNSSPG
jgi:hypothetical protein